MRSCTDCNGSGQSNDADWLQVFSQLIMMLGDEHDSRRPLHPWLASIQRNAPRNLHKPGIELKQLAAALAGRDGGRGGHDGLDTVQCFRKIVEAARLPKSWGVCVTCAGAGETK